MGIYRMIKLIVVMVLLGLGCEAQTQVNWDTQIKNRPPLAATSAQPDLVGQQQWYPTVSRFPAGTVSGLPQFICTDNVGNLWVVNDTDHNVRQMKSSTGATIGVFDSHGTLPNACLVVNNHLWVSNTGVNGGVANVAKFDLAGNFIATYSAGNTPNGMITNGTWIYICNQGDGTVTVLVEATGAFVMTIPAIAGDAGSGPIAGVFDGTYLWILASNFGRIYKLNATTGATISFTTAGTFPETLTFDGTYIWIPNRGTDNNLVAVRVSDGTKFGPFTIGGTPEGAAFGGQYVAVGVFSTDVVNFYDATTGALVVAVSTGAGTHPFGAAYGGGGVWWICLAGSNQVAKITIANEPNLQVDLNSIQVKNVLPLANGGTGTTFGYPVTVTPIANGGTGTTTGYAANTAAPTCTTGNGADGTGGANCASWLAANAQYYSGVVTIVASGSPNSTGVILDLNVPAGAYTTSPGCVYGFVETGYALAGQLPIAYFHRSATQLEWTAIGTALTAGHTYKLDYVCGRN